MQVKGERLTRGKEKSEGESDELRGVWGGRVSSSSSKRERKCKRRCSVSSRAYKTQGEVDEHAKCHRYFQLIKS